MKSSLPQKSVAQSLSTVSDLSNRPGITAEAPPKQCVRKYLPSRSFWWIRPLKSALRSAESINSRTDSIAEQATTTTLPAALRGRPLGSRTLTVVTLAPVDSRCVTLQFGHSAKFGFREIGRSSDTQVFDLKS